MSALPGFAAYAIAAALVGVHLLLLAFWTGTVRVTKKAYVNAEDAKLNKGELADAEHEDVQRVKRAHANALENAVPFFAIGALYVATGASATGAKAYCFTFLAARVLHSIFYLRGVQPFRTIGFAVGALATLGMAVHVVRVAIAAM